MSCHTFLFSRLMKRKQCSFGNITYVFFWPQFSFVFRFVKVSLMNITHRISKFASGKCKNKFQWQYLFQFKALIKFEIILVLSRITKKKTDNLMKHNILMFSLSYLLRKIAWRRCKFIPVR